MAEQPLHVLFLCTHNSARSVMAEALLNTIGSKRFCAYSAGSMPSGRVNPFAIEMAKSIGYTNTIRSKSWEEFALPGAPVMDIIITVCDNAAGESCPVWPGHPATAHWGFPDPSQVEGSREEKQRAFSQVFSDIRVRVERLVNISSENLDPPALKAELARIHSS